MDSMDDLIGGIDKRVDKGVNSLLGKQGLMTGKVMAVTRRGADIAIRGSDRYMKNVGLNGLGVEVGDWVTMMRTPDQRGWIVSGLVPDVNRSKTILPGKDRILTGAIGARVWYNGNISVSTTTYTPVSFTDVLYDTDGMFDPSSPAIVTPHTPGYYNVSGGVRWADNSTPTRLSRIVKTSTTTGSTVVATQNSTPPSGFYQYVHVSSTMIYMNGVDDYFGFQIYQNTGGSISTSGPSSEATHSYCYFACSRIA